MCDTLRTRTTFTDKAQHRRAFFVLQEPLGVGDRATATRQMEVQHHNGSSASRHHLLDVDGQFDTRNTRLRVVRETLFGEGAVLGYGNRWTQAMLSRKKLCLALLRAAEVEGKRDHLATVSCLRGLLGVPRELPPVGKIWEAA